MSHSGTRNDLTGTGDHHGIESGFPGFLTRQVTYVSAPPGWRPLILRRLRTDLLAKSIFFHGRTNRWLSARMLFKDGSMAAALHRVVQALARIHLSPIAAILYKLNGILTGAVIGRGAKLGPGLVLLHGHGVMINGGVRAGRNLILANNVTIGAEKGATPVLGDNVYIGTGAVVIGRVHVGNRARIGANAVVVKDVPDGATVVGIPARVARVRALDSDEAHGADAAAPGQNHQDTGGVSGRRH